VRARSLGKASGIEKTVPNFLLLAFAAVAAAEAFFTEVVVAGVFGATGADARGFLSADAASE
jgi:hypothetical protein